ncbi:MAG: DVUA0089 family protein [Deltaproteobacteria bacterium]
MLPNFRITTTLGLVGAIALIGCSGDDDGGDDTKPTGVAINSFTAMPTSVSAGGTTTLAWNVSRAESITINAEPGGEVTTSTDLVGSVTSGAISANTTFTLVATGGGRTVMQTASVTVEAGGPPTIQSFTANPTAAGEGTTVTLRWAATNGTQVRITQAGTEVLNSPTMANGGSLPVMMGAADTTWDLEVSNDAGMANDSVTVTLVQAANESEPNNDSASANDANVGGGVNGTLGPADEDWFSFAVTEGGNVFAQTDDGMGTCSSSTADTILELIAPDGTTVLTGNDDGVSPPCSTIDPAFDAAAAELPAGTYFVRVTGFQGAEGTYRLVVVVGEGPACGNGIIEGNSGELCDDGNTTSGDGCSATCGAEITGAGSTSLTIDVPAAGTLIPIVLDQMGQSITATTSDGNGACPYPTILALGDETLTGIGQDQSPGGCANFDPRVDAYAAVLDAGTYYIYVAGETEADTGPLTIDITVSNPECGNGILETDFNEQCEDGNTTSGDGCSMTCTIEPVGTVTGLDQDQTFSESIAPAGTQDFFTVTLPSEGYIRAETGAPTIGTCESADTVVTILDSMFAQVARNDDIGGGNRCSRVQTDALMAGTYYVRVEEFGNDAELAAYQVQIQTFGPGCGNGAVDAGEQCDDGNTTPGDGCDASCMYEVDGTVTGLNQNQTFTDALTPAGDQDLFAVVLPMDGYIIAETGAPTIGVCETDDTVIRILDSTGTSVASNDEGGINSCSLYNGLASSDLLTAGTYFVRVEEFLNDDEIAAYQVNIQTVGTGCGNGAVEPGEQCDDGNTTAGDGCDASCMFEGNITIEMEPNGDAGTATPSGATIGNTVTVSGSINPVADEDFYSFVVPTGMTASLTAVTYTVVNDPTMCTLGDTRIFLFDSAMTELADDDDTNGLCSQIDGAAYPMAANLAAGTYYIRVQHYANTESFGPYLMDITLQ